MSHQAIFLKALRISFPIALAYIPLGLVLGLLVENQGYHWILGPLMNVFNFAGAVQFSALSFLEQGAGLIELILACFFIGIRNAFYGPAFFDRFARFSRIARYYLIFGLVDSTYALLLSPTPVPPEEDQKYCLYLTGLIHFYWILGGVIGGAFGRVIPEIKGLEFTLTILFAILAFEQYLKNKKGWVFLVGLVSWCIMQYLWPSFAFLGAIFLSGFIFSLVLYRR